MYLATPEIFHPESEEPILLVGLEHGRVGVRAEVGLAASRVDKVAPVVVVAKSKIKNISFYYLCKIYYLRTIIYVKMAI